MDCEGVPGPHLRSNNLLGGKKSTECQEKGCAELIRNQKADRGNYSKK